MNVTTESATNRKEFRRVAICGQLLILSLVGVASFFLTGHIAVAQQNDKHFLYDYQMPPGEIAWRKSLMRDTGTGYFQPIDLVVPDGAEVSVYSEGAFQSTTAQQGLAGMMVGHIYRLKVTGIPGYPGREAYPSVEILGRLFPPAGNETRVPIPVHIPIEDLEPALDGNLVTRVVYLENPRNAIPERRSVKDQAFFDVGPGQDPIRVAEKFGRPMAIVRIGSRIPDQDELNGFGFGTPPMRWFDVSLIQWSDEIDPIEGEIESRLPKGGDQHVSLTIDPAVAPASWQEPVVEKVNEGATGAIGDKMIDAVVEGPLPFSPAEQQGAPIIVQQIPNPSIPYVVMPQPANPQPWPDEVLFDGGDRGLQAVIREREGKWEVNGLDSEDTIGHFDTLDGRHILDSSNRVQIYAPRFSAIRKIDLLGITQYTTEIGDLNEKMITSQQRHNDASSTTLQNMQPLRNRSTAQARGVDDMTRGVVVDNTTQYKRASSAFKSYEDLRLLKTGHFDNREKGRLAIAMTRANAWENTVSAQSADSKLQLVLVNDVASANETVHVKTEFNRPQLRIVKVASTDVALPGDEIEFTIRFDNVGDQPIGNVTIMDNLAGRLEYIDGSTECSIDGSFNASPNNRGSQTLSWEITEPLKVSQGGIIRFRCLVR